MSELALTPEAALLLRGLAFLAGLFLVFFALKSAVRTLVLPRSTQDRLTRTLFRGSRWTFDLMARFRSSYEGRDALMAYYAPVTLLLLLPFWLLIVLVGFALMYIGIGIGGWHEAWVLSESALFTLGFAREDAPAYLLLNFAEATIGLILVALIIAYLPTMYDAFSRREKAVNLLSVRAGNPPWAPQMLERFSRISNFERLGVFYEEWEAWFADLEESHTSLAALVFFRSPQPDESWVTAAGTVLDTAALHEAVVDLPPEPRAALCIRAGYIALRRIADQFGIRYEEDPRWPAHPISIERADFDEACERLAQGDVPLKSDREQAWRDYAGWRVNYDEVLLGLARITMAPEAPWSSDRAWTWTAESAIREEEAVARSVADRER